jgi:hypothetical protein
VKAQVFLLSPASCAGKRAAILLKPDSSFDLAVRLRAGTLTLGEAFSFLSGLYFRGKLTYGQRFGHLPSGGDSTLVITPTRGLQAPASFVTGDDLREFASVDVAADDIRYRGPFERDLRALHGRLPARVRVILLGSIATSKYVDILAGIVGHRLHYPSSFIGRGDMSRGGLLLRAARAGVELDYARLDPAVSRHGTRPSKLEPEKRHREAV